MFNEDILKRDYEANGEALMKFKENSDLNI